MRFHASGARLYLFQMVLGIVVLDAVAIAAFTLTDLRFAGANARLAFTIVWTVATALVVGIGLRRIRLARRGGPPRP